MIGAECLEFWSHIAPWIDPIHVEQDLIISRAAIY